MYTNYNLWDRLQTCIVGRSWPPEFYSRINNSQVRSAMETIAIETEESYLNLIKLLQKFEIDVLRPEFLEDVTTWPLHQKSPMAPSDHMIMLGQTFIETFNSVYPGVGETPYSPESLPKPKFYDKIFDHIKSCGNTLVHETNPAINNAMIYQLGKKIYFSSWNWQDRSVLKKTIMGYCNDQDVNNFFQPGHMDAWFCPVTPGLIICSNDDGDTSQLLTLFFKTFFKDWEVIYLDPSLKHSPAYQTWRRSATRKWWLRDQEKNSQLIDFINTYFNNWTGNVEETVFEINMVVIDDKNCILDRYNQRIFKRLEHYGVTPHISNLKHVEFWDCGIHCSVCDINRIREN